MNQEEFHKTWRSYVIVKDDGKKLVLKDYFDFVIGPKNILVKKDVESILDGGLLFERDKKDDKKSIVLKIEEDLSIFKKDNGEWTKVGKLIHIDEI